MSCLRRFGRVGGVVALVASLGASRRAEASPSPPVYGIALLFTLAPVPLFTVVDLYYAGKGSWARPAWAWPEVASGALLGAMGVGALASGPLSGNQGYGIVATGFGTAFVLHGVLSLANWEEPLEPAAWEVDDGTAFGVTGRF